MQANKNIAAALAATLVMSGCATQPSNVTAAYVSAMKFEGQGCERLLREAEDIDIRLRQVTGTLQTRANTDAVLVGVGLLLFWPALLALPATGGKAEEAELARLKGEADAVTRAIKDRNCEMPKPAQEASADPSIVPVVAPAK
jgi:hypothetical protein